MRQPCRYIRASNGTTRNKKGEFLLVFNADFTKQDAMEEAYKARWIAWRLIGIHPRGSHFMLWVSRRENITCTTYVPAVHPKQVWPKDLDLMRWLRNSVAELSGKGIMQFWVRFSLPPLRNLCSSKCRTLSYTTKAPDSRDLLKLCLIYKRRLKNAVWNTRRWSFFNPSNI